MAVQSLFLPLALVLLTDLTGCKPTEMSGSSGTKQPPKKSTPKESTNTDDSEYQSRDKDSTPSDELETEEGRNEVFIGGDQTIFHIGDDKFNDSGCLDLLKKTTPSGRQAYQFAFTVTSGPVDVDLSIELLCGVDNKSNTVSLWFGNQEKKLTNLSPNASGYSVPQQSLNTGDYRMIVTAKGQFGTVGLDNFLVGKVKVRASDTVITNTKVTAL